MDHQDEQQDKQMASQDSHHFITEDDLQVVTGGEAVELPRAFPWDREIQNRLPQRPPSSSPTSFSLS
jgi:hypothetical protein